MSIAQKRSILNYRITLNHLSKVQAILESVHPASISSSFTDSSELASFSPSVMELYELFKDSDFLMNSLKRDFKDIAKLLVRYMAYLKSQQSVILKHLESSGGPDTFGKDGFLNLDQRDGNGDTAFHIACRKGYVEVVEGLAVGVGVRRDVVNVKGEMPLHAVMKSKDVSATEAGRQIVGVLLKGMSEDETREMINRVIPFGEGFTGEQVAGEGEIVSGDAGGPSVFQTVFLEGEVEMIEYALTLGGDLNTVVGITGEPYLFACLLKGNLKFAKMLVFHGADLDVRHTFTTLKNSDSAQSETVLEIVKGDTPLHVACRLGNVELVTIMMDMGARCTGLENSDGDLPFHVACRNGYWDVVRVLLDVFGKALLNFPGKDKRLAVHMMCFGKLYDVKYGRRQESLHDSF
jgi:ankyrin repeat protein